MIGVMLTVERLGLHVAHASANRTISFVHADHKHVRWDLLPVMHLFTTTQKKIKKNIYIYSRKYPNNSKI